MKIEELKRGNELNIETGPKIKEQFFKFLKDNKVYEDYTELFDSNYADNQYAMD